ncbi:hypothetical protein GCM10011452_30870 [Gemmobacter lanyuensis]|uniref:Uncharacterized protein n=1 Tax=Gemmobacter lanyuensis TaxID=1054497 RepID=A0A918MP74_9RHOB|nr:hypothetical protein GCM10011452_30870 [Gemmobacter lanyuensis]
MSDWLSIVFLADPAPPRAGYSWWDRAGESTGDASSKASRSPPFLRCLDARLVSGLGEWPVGLHGT